MKWCLFLFTLVLSLNGWCAAITSSRTTAHITAQGHANVENGKQNEEKNSPLLLDKMKAVLIGCGLLTYFTAIFWWAITAKKSLDEVLENVIQDMARYPS